MGLDSMPAKVLIVDDSQENIDLISYFLKPLKYTIIVAMDGETALEKAASEKPDIILLDIMLPKLNGFEVCERIKKDPETQFIPVVMITALKELKDKIHSLEVGADDFISKPFENVELITRVKSLLRIKRYQDELAEKNKALVRMDQFKEDLAHLLVHDMRNPIFVIQGNLQMMGMGLSGESALAFKKYLDRIDRSTQHLLRMVQNLVDIAKIEDGTMALNKDLCRVNDIVKQCVEKISDYPEHAKKNISVQLDSSIPYCSLDASVIDRVFDNLLTFSISNVTATGNVSITTEVKDDAVWVFLEDDGIQIPLKYQDLIFTKFGQVEVKNEGYRVGRGLALTFSKLAIEAHNGSIELDKKQKVGNRFIIKIPCSKK